jgi:uncharacterized protein YqeY
MSQLKAQIQSTLSAAMKARESQKVQALRNITSAIKKKEVDERKELTDADVQKILLSLEKQLKESLDQAKSAGRAEAIQENEFEIAIIKQFLPQPLSEEELKKMVQATYEELKNAGSLPAGAAGMGALMKATMAKVGARADGKSVQAAVKSILE